MLDEEHEVYYGKNGRIIHLTFMENLVLSILIEAKNKTIISYATFMNELNISSQNLGTIIHRLRKKFKDEFKIYTKNGFGYFLK